VAEAVPDLLATPDKKAYKPTDILASVTKVIQHQQEQIQQLLDQLAQESSGAQPHTQRSNHHACTA